MLKPTSILNFKLLEYVINDPKVKKALLTRDNHNDAQSRNLTVSFDRQLNGSKSVYRVDFIYLTKFPYEEKTDDVCVYVEVTENEKQPFKIVKWFFY